MIKLTSALPTYNLKNKRVILRTDWNVPRSTSGAILDDYKLRASLTTLEYLYNHGAHVIILTHSGRPEKNKPELSTDIFIPWLKKQKHALPACFAPTIQQARELQRNTENKIILLENMRFFTEEASLDTSFAQELAALGDYFVQDAFGVCHRNSCSMTVLPRLFTPETRTIGFLIEHELKNLETLVHNPQKPYTLLQGGIKISTKLPLLTNMLDHVDQILISTPLAFTFLKAQNYEIGKSYYEPEMLTQATDFLHKAHEQAIPVILPIDYQVTTRNFDHPYPLVIKENFEKDDCGVSIGPKTAALYNAYLKKSATIFINGLPGNQAYPETLEGSRLILQALLDKKNYIIGGGDSLAIVAQTGFEHSPLSRHMSTGGGATLAYVSNQMLPGLVMFQ